MDRYFINWAYEELEEDQNGNWCKYSDVAALEAQLQQAQAQLKGLEVTISQWRNTWDFKAFREALPLADTVNTICQELSDSLIDIGFKEQQIDQVEAENAELRADNAEITETLQNIKSIMDESEGIAGWHKNGDISPWDEGIFQDVVKSLIVPHPGAALLKELEALRMVRIAAEELSNWMNENEILPGVVLLKQLRNALAAAKGAD